jgi:hypothetical protein
MIERTNKQDGKGIPEEWKEMQMPKFMQQRDINLSFRQGLLPTLQ